MQILFSKQPYYLDKSQNQIIIFKNAKKSQKEVILCHGLEEDLVGEEDGEPDGDGEVILIRFADGSPGSQEVGGGWDGFITQVMVDIQDMDICQDIHHSILPIQVDPKKLNKRR